MYWEKCQRPKDVGTHSFKDFSQSLTNQTKNLKKSFKHLSQQKSLQSSQNYRQKQLSQSNNNEENVIPNQKFHGETWDSKHMDTFLKDQQWSNTLDRTTYSNLNSDNNTRKSGTGYSKRTRSFKSNGTGTDKSQGAPRTASSSFSKSSFFFNTVSRFNPEQDNFKAIDYQNNYSNHNFMVFERPTNSDKAKSYFDKKFVPEKQNFNDKKIEFTEQNMELMSPRQAREVLNETKKNQKQFSEWKKNHMNQTKRLRVHKSEYRSGIIDLDNPYNSESGIYSEESNKLAQKIKHSKEIQERYKQQVEKRTDTNFNIEFYNSNKNNQKRASFQKQIDPRHEKLNPIWNNKKRVDNEAYNCQAQSQERLFGGPIEGKYNVKRAEQLKENDHKGRDYNFLSYTKSHLSDFQSSFLRKSENKQDKRPNQSQNNNNNNNNSNQFSVQVTQL